MGRTVAFLLAVSALVRLPERLVLDPLLGDGPASDLLAVALPVLLTVAVAPMVSYRRRDAVAWVIPALGLLLMARLGWRLAALPHRDWPLRADEVARLRETGGAPAVPGR